MQMVEQTLRDDDILVSGTIDAFIVLLRAVRAGQGKQEERKHGDE